MFYSWLSTGITIVNKEFFQEFPDPAGHDPDCHQYLIDCSLGHTTPYPLKISKNL